MLHMKTTTGTLLQLSHRNQDLIKLHKITGWADLEWSLETSSVCQVQVQGASQQSYDLDFPFTVMHSAFASFTALLSNALFHYY